MLATIKSDIHSQRSVHLREMVLKATRDSFTLK